MKRIIGIYIFFLLIGVWIITGCSTDGTPNQPVTGQPLAVNGAESCAFSRSESDAAGESIAEGSSLSLYASGALSASGLTLTLSDGVWTGSGFPQWDATQGTATVSAVCPSLSSLSDGLYQADGTLTDVLYDRQENLSQPTVTLNFKHLFSKVVFQLTQALNAEVERIGFTPSQSVTEIQSPDMTPVFGSTELHTVMLERNEEGTYSVIVPPAADMSVEVTVYTTGGETLQARLGSRNFESGHEYHVAMRKESGTSSEPGIYTVEDFIAFTHLINGVAYEEKALTDFGCAENGVTTYRLKSDLTFTAEQSKEICVMMNNAKGQFADCFDGENHTLYQMVIPTQSVSRILGLFTTIASAGVVKNLRIDNLSYKMTTEKYNAGILCGVNYGTIDNCHITNSTVTGNGASKTDNRELGGLAYSNQGVISNSSCTGVGFSGKYDYFGGLVNVNYKGKILNCYIANCSFKPVKGYASIAFQHSDGAQVYNCYASDNAHTGTGYLFSKMKGAVVANCFYNETTTNTVSDDQDGNTAEFTPFTSDTASAVLTELNAWGATQGVTLFPTLTFMQWTSADTPPFRFVGQ